MLPVTSASNAVYFKSDAKEEPEGDRVQEAAGGALHKIAEAFRVCGRALYRFFAAILETISTTVRKIILFLRRHKWVFLTYAISLAIMIAMGATAGQIAAALVPGMVWTLANVKGELLPEDLLIQGRAAGTPSWMPHKREEAGGSKALIKRLDLVDRALHAIQVKGELGWVLLHGEPRIGKSVIADEILKRAEANGHQIFRLSKEIYDCDSKNPYLTVAETLSQWGKDAEKPPILFIDEFGRIPQKLFRAIYENKIHCNILAVQSDLKEDDFHELEFYERFEKIKVPNLEVQGCIVTLQNCYKEEILAGESIACLVKELACRLGVHGKQKVLFHAIKAIERASLAIGKDKKIPWEALQEAIQTIKLYKKNFVELLPRVQREEVPDERQETINEFVWRLSKGHAYLCTRPDDNAEPCMREILSRMQDQGHPIYAINKFYFREKNKFLSVNHMLETMAKTLTIAAKHSLKTPIFFVDNRMTASPADIFKKYFDKTSFHIFVFDEKIRHNSNIQCLFDEFIKPLSELDKETILREAFRHTLTEEVIERVFVKVKDKLGSAEKIKAYFYYRAEKILSTVQRLIEQFPTVQNVEDYIDRCNWNYD